MKQILEFVPLVIFFISYKKFGLITATLILVITSLISCAILTLKEKKLALMPLISAIILGIFGFLTWYLQDPIFIKIKPTILNSLFGAILLFSYFLKKPWLKFLFSGAFTIEDKYWVILGLRFGIYFFFLALLNEMIWRNFSEGFWVSFKVFGMLPISIVFTLSQIPFVMKHQEER